MLFMNPVVKCTKMSVLSIASLYLKILHLNWNIYPFIWCKSCDTMFCIYLSWDCLYILFSTMNCIFVFLPHWQCLMMSQYNKMFIGNQLLLRHAEQIIFKEVPFPAFTKINLMMQFDVHRIKWFTIQYSGCQTGAQGLPWVHQGFQESLLRNIPMDGELRLFCVTVVYKTSLTLLCEAHLCKCFYQDSHKWQW